MKPKTLLISALLAGALPAAAAGKVSPVASYRIAVSWDDASKKLTGEETVTFVNRTSWTFREIELHLYLNAFKNERSTFRREAPPEKHRDDPAWYGYVEVNRVVLEDGTDLTSSLRYVSPDDGNPDDQTVARIPLPDPVPPGATLSFHVDFVSKLPRNTSRTGFWGDFLFAGQWFPKLGKATDSGWLTHQFHAATEFFADFGNYDVTLDLPSAMKGKVGATGVEKETVELAGGRIRSRFIAEGVHDFAWAASPRFEIRRATFSHPGLPNVSIVLLLQPEHRSVGERYLSAAQEALARFGTWFVPYPYPVLTIVDPPYGSGAGGMEYPTLFTGGAAWLSPRSVPDPEGVTVHEFGHQVFYGLLASNETDEAHLDEGLNSWATDRVMKEVYGDPPLRGRVFGIPIVVASVRVPYADREGAAYLDAQAANLTDSMATPTFRHLSWDAVGLNAYAKTALLLSSAERTIGRPAWDRILKTYTTRWAFRHPTTRDFLQAVREVSPGTDRLLERAWQSAETYDYAVASAKARKLDGPAGYFGEGTALKFVKTEPKKVGGAAIWESEAVVRRLGAGVWPVTVELVFEGGHVVRRSWDGVDRWVRYRATGPKLVSATVDPDRNLLLDVDVLNNGKLVEPDPTAAGWLAHRLRFWGQNLLEFFTLLATTTMGALP